MKILDDDKVLDFLDAENNGSEPAFSTENTQLKCHFACGCITTEDKKGGSVFPCSDHYNHFNELRDGKILHKVLH